MKVVSECSCWFKVRKRDSSTSGGKKRVGPCNYDYNSKITIEHKYVCSYYITIHSFMIHRVYDIDYKYNNNYYYYKHL